MTGWRWFGILIFFHVNFIVQVIIVAAVLDCLCTVLGSGYCQVGRSRTGDGLAATIAVIVAYVLLLHRPDYLHHTGGTVYKMCLYINIQPAHMNADLTRPVSKV